MRILIIGSTGSLGHYLFSDLSASHEVWGTVRSNPEVLRRLANVRSDRVIEKVDVTDLTTVECAVDAAEPDVVINCAALIRHREHESDRLAAIDMNARFPHQLARICATVGVRLIHFSTDCVFSGRTGNYRETDATDASDVYGMSKALGDIVDKPGCLTLRTSFIGRELTTHYGLVEWFLSQSGSVKGYRRAVFSGFTTQEIARILRTHVLPRTDLSGLYHVSSSPINKYDLLQLVKQAYGHPVNIEPDDQFVIDRSLNSDRFRALTEYIPPSWDAMIADMALHPAV